MFCKLSITVQCYRVLRTPKMQKFFKLYFVILALFGSWTVLSTVFQCWPIQYYWNFMSVRGKCMDKAGVTFANAGVNILTDLLLIVIPVPMLWKLQLPQRQKLILMFIFGVGLFATITSVIRLVALREIGLVPEPLQRARGVNIAIWSCIEINTGIMCASVPALKPLIARYFPSFIISDLYAKTRGGAGYYAKPVGGSQKGTHPMSSNDNNSSGSGSGKGGSGRTDSNHHHPHKHRSRLSIGGSTIRPGGGFDHGGSGGHNWATEIQVEQSIEMRSVPINQLDLTDDDSRKPSRDGSEKGLVRSAWQADYYAGRQGAMKKVTITSGNSPPQ